ncbi:MAG: hypothetical protein IMY76_05980 [Chloroflexi bacterium]|nr:hypothetical protein [Chloroflexota bacterium]
MALQKLPDWGVFDSGELLRRSPPPKDDWIRILSMLGFDGKGQMTKITIGI